MILRLQAVESLEVLEGEVQFPDHLWLAYSFDLALKCDILPALEVQKLLFAKNLLAQQTLPSPSHFSPLEFNKNSLYPLEGLGKTLKGFLKLKE